MRGPVGAPHEMLKNLMGISSRTDLLEGPALADAATAEAAGLRAPAGLQPPNPLLTAVALVATDVVALAAAAAVGALLATAVGAPAEGTATWRPVYLLALLPAAFGAAGLYPAAGLGPVAELRRLTSSSLVVLGIAAVVLGLTRTAIPPLAMLGAGAAALAFVPLARAVVRGTLGQRAWWGVPAAVLGAGEAAGAVIERLRADPTLGLRPVVCLVDDAGTAGARAAGLPVAAPPTDAAAARALGVRHAILPIPADHAAALRHLARQAGHAFPTTVVMSAPSVGPIAADPRAVGGALGVFVTNHLEHRLERAGKLAVDAVLLLPTLVFGLPAIALAALAVMLVSPGNPFYAQEREGLGGRTIRVWKLRTMHKNAAVLLERHLRDHPEAREEWARHFKLQHDPRILPVVGKVLRVTSLDELPQVLNVLRGDMSFVGPRPFPRYHLDAFSEEFRALRASVRPGITGLWQVSARSDGDLRVQEEADTYYVRHWSLWLDLYILARTPVAVLSARGAR